MNETLSAYAWQIRAPILQNAEQQWTHARRLPLPATLDAYVCGCHFRALYRGHGVCKVAYLLEAVHPNDGHPLAGKVLKLCKEADPEPKLFAEYGFRAFTRGFMRQRPFLSSTALHNLSVNGTAGSQT